MKKVILLVGLLTVMLTGCTAKKQAETANQTVSVKAMEVSPGVLTTEGTYIGVIENTEAVELVSQVTGTIKEVNVSVGDTVSQGSVLARFDDTSARIDLETAQAGVKSAEGSLRSAQKSVESAQTGYNSAMINGNNQLGPSHHLSDYQSQMNIKSIESNIAYQEDKIRTYKETTLQEAIDDVDEYEDKKKKAKKEGNDAAYEEYKTKLESAEDALESAEKGLKDLEYTYKSTINSYETAVGSRDITNNEVYLGQQLSVLNSLESAQNSIDSAKIGVDNAAIGVESAQTKVDAAEYKLSLYTLTSPIDGIIEEVNVEENNYFSAGNISFVISNPHSRRVVFHVPDTVAGELLSGQGITAVSNGKTYDGEITEIGVAVDDTGLFQVKATLYEAGDLSDGVNIRINTTIHRSENNIVVPSTAIYFKNNQGFVYIAEEGRAVRKDVTVDIYGSELTTLTEGLNKGDLVITTWSGSMHEGSEISVEREAESVSEVELSPDKKMAGNTENQKNSAKLTAGVASFWE